MLSYLARVVCLPGYLHTFLSVCLSVCLHVCFLLYNRLFMSFLYVPYTSSLFPLSAHNPLNYFHNHKTLLWPQQHFYESCFHMHTTFTLQIHNISCKKVLLASPPPPPLLKYKLQLYAACIHILYFF
jgi:hypothetical protein